MKNKNDLERFFVEQRVDSKTDGMFSTFGSRLDPLHIFAFLQSDSSLFGFQKQKCAVALDVFHFFQTGKKKNFFRKEF